MILCSCSIKEDRGPCPCHLNIFLENCADYSDMLSVSGWSLDARRLFLDRVDLGGNTKVHTRKVEKGSLTVSAYCNTGAMTLKGDRLVIPEGKQGDRLWAFAGDPVDAEGEYAEEHIFLHKQYADIHIITDELSRNAGDMILRATGNTEGLSILSLAPETGKFSCFVTQPEESGWVFTVPRQVDSSLELEVYLDGVLRKKIPVGKLVENSGYSWKKEDLDDIYMSFSLFSEFSAQISIAPWDTEKVTLSL